MVPITTVLGRLGSRFSLTLDPVRRHVQYGAVGLFHQRESHLVCELRDAGGPTAALPLAGDRPGFQLLSQRQTLTRILYEAHHPAADARLVLELIAPFLPRDERMCLAPAYLARLRVEPLRHRLRWTGPAPAAERRGTARFALEVPGAETVVVADGLLLRYDTPIIDRHKTGEGGIDRTLDATARTAGADEARCEGRIEPLEGPWRVVDGGFELDYDLREGPAEGWLVLSGWFAEPCFEAGHVAGPLRYVTEFGTHDAVLEYMRAERGRIVAAADFVDGLVTDSSLPKSLQDLIAFSFHSYLACTLWADLGGRDWFSVWEGSCWYNSTVDVEHNNGLVYFGLLWPELLERIFEEWSHHRVPAPVGCYLEHDMGSGWTCNGQSYHHPMEVEENCNYLLQYHAAQCWWGGLPEPPADLLAELTDYLLWSDSTGNGFPDRGTANTIDDATPAVQYGRDQVYLGVKRLAALHAAARMFEAQDPPDAARAAACYEAVDRAVETLQAFWLGDHYPVCLDATTSGLADAWSGEPLPYEELPGWDAYSLYTANGLLYLLMVDDLPSALDLERLRLDARAVHREAMTEYGCTHSSADPDHLWVSMNLWRDQIAAYLGDDLLGTADRYWQMQIAANIVEAKGFIDTSYTNNLCFYPRGIASIGALWAAAGLRVRGCERLLSFAPPGRCRVPLLPLADWSALRVPWLLADSTDEGLDWSIENEDLLAGWDIVPRL